MANWIAGLALCCFAPGAVAGTVLAWGPPMAVPNDTNIIAIAAGYAHNLALESDGTVLEWGSSVSRILSNVVAIAAGGQHSLALKSNGTVVAWGQNQFGQTYVPSGLSNVVAISAGAYHSLALKSDGTVVSWGAPRGDLSPPATLSNVVAIAGGLNFSLALQNDGTLVGWGDPAGSELDFPATASNIVAIAAGPRYGLALRSDGTVIESGILSVPPPPDLSNVVAIARGYDATDALVADGTVRDWDQDSLDYGQPNLPSSIRNAVAVSSGTDSLALVGDAPPVPLSASLYLLTLPVVHNARATRNLVAWVGEDLQMFPVGQAHWPSTYEWLINGTTLLKSNQPTLVLTNIQPEQAGDYSLNVISTLGLAGSLDVFLSVVPLLITQQPKTQQVLAGTDVSLAVAASGQSPFTYQWQFNGTNLIGETNATLDLKTVTLDQKGLYSVAVSNSFGGSQSSAAIISVAPLLITTQPQSQSVLVGTNVVFQIAASGSAPFNYQWQFNGTNIDGQTNVTLVQSNVSLAESGVYAVIVSNAYGTVTSSNAGLFVVPLFMTLEPTNQSVIAGTDVELDASVSGPGSFNYQWQFEGKAIPGGTNSTLLLPSVSPGQSGRYSLEISNEYGTVNSSTIAISVAPLSVLISPQNVSSFLRGSLSLDVGTAGQGPFVYQWQFQGTNLTGATNTVLSLSNLSFAQAGSYSAIVSNSFGAVTNSTDLYVSQIATWGTTPGPPPGSLTNVAAIAVGDSFGAALLGNGRVVAWGDNSTGETNVPPDLTNAVDISVGFVFQFVLALRSDGTVVGWGDYAHGELNIPPGLTNVVAVCAGQEHGLALLASGTLVGWGGSTPPNDLSNVIAIATGAYHSLALKSDGTVIAWGANDFGQSSVPSTASNVVAIACGKNYSLALNADGTIIGWGDDSSGQLDPPAGLNDAVGLAAGWNSSLALRANGTVVCWGDNASGQSSPPLSLNGATAVSAGRYSNFSLISETPILEPVNSHHLVIGLPRSTISQRAFEAAALVGETVQVFSVSSGATPAYQWLLNGTPLLGATNANLSLTNLQIAQSGSYSLRISNSFGFNFSSEVLLTVLPFLIVTQPQSQKTLGGSNIVFQANAAGPGPFMYQWLFNGTNLSGGTNAELSLTNVLTSQSGVYSVAISNSYGSRVSLSALLTVDPFDFIGPPEDQTAFAGTNVLFSVALYGQGPFTYRWQFNGNDITQATNSTLELVDVQEANAGVYSAIVANRYGFLSTNATLFVNSAPPTLVTQPMSHQAFFDLNTSFAVVARGSEPFVYQWQKNGTNLSSATNSVLILSNVQITDAGLYSVIVSNAFGTASSSNAMLTPVFSSVVAWGDDSSMQTNVPAWLTNAVALGGGSFHTLALLRDSRVIAWGDLETTNVPAGLSNVVDMAAGGLFSLALTVDGTVSAWGFNITGAVDVPTGLSNVVAVAAGLLHSLALKGDGTVLGWGDNSYGEAKPPATLHSVTAIATGSAHSLALKADGTVIAWGNNSYGQTNTPTDLTNVIAIAGGNYHSLALKKDGTVVAWGDNVYGQSTVPPGLSNVVRIAVAAGGNHNLALKSDGTLAAWGSSRYGQTKIPAGLGNIVDIAGGYAHSSALLANGSAMVIHQPPSRFTYTGTTIGFNLFAGGQQPLTFQWQFQGTNLSNENSAMLILTNVSLAASGYYQCVVSNSLGTVISHPCFLDVRRSPFQFDPTNLVLGSTTGLQIELVGLSGHGPVILYSSTNFTDWIAMSTNPPTLGSLQFKDPTATNPLPRFYRAVEE